MNKQTQDAIKIMREVDAMGRVHDDLSMPGAMDIESAKEEVIWSAINERGYSAENAQAMGDAVEAYLRTNDAYAATPTENAIRMAAIAGSYRDPAQHRGLADRQGFIRRAQNSCATFATFAAMHGDEPDGEEVGEPTPVEMFPSLAENLMHFMAGARRNSPEFWAEVNSWTAKK